MSAHAFEPWGGPKLPRAAAAPRVAGQIRRTTSVDMSWPDGLGGDLLLHGRGRDILTAAGGRAVVLAAAELQVSAGSDRALREILVAHPSEPRLENLRGVRLGPGFRAAATAALGDEHLGSLLALLVDDLPVTALISGFGRMLAQYSEGVPKRPASVQRIGTCTGWRDGGAPALRARAEEAAYHPEVVVASPPEVDDGDTDAWHAMPPLPPLAMRRRRRLDVTPGDPVLVEAWFRDSVAAADGTEAALHEYTVHGEIDDFTGTVSWLESTPHVLPYVDCSGAAPSSRLLDGTPLRELRATVRGQLTGVVGCTHLNDELRSIADVEYLLQLPRSI
ncbi:MAG TPA: DUF2889 domain-containing protein [Candidatus Dormibacteraeota bacterium]|jgi:hypothetical protein|nr:DUF2889 domain-containing protein [Candidatus Dormibacteraeota bacterium]